MCCRAGISADRQTDDSCDRIDLTEEVRAEPASKYVCIYVCVCMCVETGYTHTLARTRAHTHTQQCCVAVFVAVLCCCQPAGRRYSAGSSTFPPPHSPALTWRRRCWAGASSWLRGSCCSRRSYPGQPMRSWDRYRQQWALWGHTHGLRSVRRSS